MTSPVQSAGPLSAAERRFWDLGPRTELAWPNALEVAGPLDRGALDRAWHGLVARHDLARTRFAAGPDREPHRVVEAPGPARPLPFTDLTDRSDRLNGLVTAEREAVADLTRGPLLRAHLVRSGPDRHLVLVTGHNVVLDDWSVGLLWRDLGALYRRESDHGCAPLPPVAVSGAAHAAEQAARLADDGPAGLERIRHRWQGLTGTQLPESAGPADSADRQPEFSERIVPAAWLAALRERAGVAGASDFVLALAAFATALSAALGRDEVTIGTSTAGRTAGEAQTLGYFVNRLLLRLDGTGDLPEVVTRARTAVYTELADAGLPFEYLVKNLRPGEYERPAPVADVLLVSAGTAPEPDFGPLAANPRAVAEPLNRFGLVVLLRPAGAGLVVQVHRGAHADRTAVADVLDRFVDILAGSEAEAGSRRPLEVH